MGRYLCIAVLVVALATIHFRQEQLITVDVDLVNIYFTVQNQKGRLITNLGHENFRIFEDGTPQVITNLGRETDVPLTVDLLSDTGGSVRDKLPFEREAATGFLNTSLRPGFDHAAVFSFDSTVEMRQDYTNDTLLLANAVTQLAAGGGTRLYDALHYL